MTNDDVPAVGDIWLAASLIAHGFVPADFWHADHKVMTSEILPGSHGYVHETNGKIDGFVALGSGKRSNYMGALFVSPECQGQGIGTRLLDHVKAIRNPLTTSVYKQNQRSFEFYKTKGFQVIGESVCEHTGCEEYQLEWTPNRTTTNRKLARELATESIERGKPLDWFETLYRLADGDESVVPWADMTVNPSLSTWLEQSRIEGTGRKALVVGCGLGDDAEALATLGFQVTAFDISATCIRWCRQRFPESSVMYSVADLFAPPSAWRQAFDFVLEVYTLQVLPDEQRTKAIPQIAEFVAPDGKLLVISRGRSEGDQPGTMPWPLLQTEFAAFNKFGLREVTFEDYIDDEEPPVIRFRAEYRRLL